MSLSSVIDRYADKTRTRDVERMCNNALCPDCGEEGEEMRGYYRCTSDYDECGVITFMKTTFRSRIADQQL